jgi:D-3-phosphoglycerate dehydrogenase
MTLRWQSYAGRNFAFGHFSRPYNRRSEVASLSEPVEALILDLLEWLGPTPRPYAEVMDAWRTSCPRLPVWEEANDRGLVERLPVPGAGVHVAPSSKGRAHLCRARSSTLQAVSGAD